MKALTIGLALVALAACTNTRQISGSRNGVAVQPGGTLSANPEVVARAHCAQYDSAAVLSRTELIGVGRVLDTVYYFDCRPHR